MKRYGNIYEKICDMNNLREAHRNARKDKLFYAKVVMVDSDPDKYLLEIREMLINHTYSVNLDDYSISTINDKGKQRELWKLPYFPHRIRRSICSQNSFFFVRACDSSSIRPDRLICLFMPLFYHRRSQK